jgi:hypothetical protein
VADIDPSLVQQILDIAERKRKPDVEHHRQADDFGRGLEVFEWARLGHQRRLGPTSPRLNPSSFYRTLGCSIPFQFRKRGVESKLIIGDGQAKTPDKILIRSIAKAHQYYDAIKMGRTFEEIAASENLSKRRIPQVIDLAFLAPDIVKSITQGDQPIGLTAKWLGQNPLPSDWQAQRQIINRL